MSQKTFFDTLPKSFSDVPIDAEHDNAIATGPFLEAAESLGTLFGTFFGKTIPLSHSPLNHSIGILSLRPLKRELTCFLFPLDVLGSVAFTPVKSDITGNVKKIRERQLAAPAQSETLQSLVVNELKAKKHIATEGLLWLVR